MKGEERVEIAHGLYPTNVILTSKIVSWIIYSIRLMGKFDWCNVIMEATKIHVSFKNETLGIIWIDPSVMSGKYGNWSVADNEVIFT